MKAKVAAKGQYGLLRKHHFSMEMVLERNNLGHNGSEAGRWKINSVGISS